MVFTLQTSFAIGLLAIIPIAVSLWLKKSFFWSIKGRHVVIAGGSSDIGLWIAIRCVKLGAHVTLLGRNDKKLDTAREKIKLFRTNDKQMIQSRTIDLSKNYDEVSSLLGTLEDEVGPIYWLVNCAGSELYGRHIDTFPDDAIYLMNCKYFAIYNPTRYVLEQMKKRGEGKITITGTQAKELVLEQYGHQPINFEIYKRSPHGLADMINAKNLNKNVSITLVLSDTDTHDFGQTNFEMDSNRVHIISDRNAPKSEDIANRIVCDSLNGKKISILGWENWINLNVWKFSHLLQTVLQRLRRFGLNKCSKDQVKDDSASSVAQMPTKFIDCLSVQKDDTEKNTVDVPLDQKSNENLHVDDVPVEQQPSDKPSPDTQDNLVVQQEAEPNVIGDDQSENTEATDATSTTKLISDETFPTAFVQSTVDLSNDTLPTSTVESKNTIDFGGPTKKLASTGAFVFGFGTSHDKPTNLITKTAETMPSSSILTEPNSSEDNVHQNKPESSHHRQSEPSNGQKSADNTEPAFIFGPNSKSKKIMFSVDASSTTTNTKPTNQNGSSSDVTSSTKSAPENVNGQKDLDALKKEILSLYNGPITDHTFKFPAKMSKNEKSTAATTVPVASSTGSIGMEMFGKKADTVKPSFSFNLPESSDLFGVNAAKSSETAMKFSFNASKESDTQKPFMFQAKSMEDVSEKSTRESINPKSKLPTRATVAKRMK